MVVHRRFLSSTSKYRTKKPVLLHILHNADDDQADLYSEIGRVISHVTGYRTRGTACLLHFLCSVVFLRSVWSRFPIGCCQGPIPVSKLCFTVAGSAVVFYLSGLGPYPLSFPLWPYEFTDYLIFDWTLPIAHQQV